MLASITSATVLGVRGCPITVEVYVGEGLPGYHLVGLPDTVCKESRNRIRAAFAGCELVWPNRNVTINLAPAGEKKSGAGLDLAIAVGILVATEQLPPEGRRASRSSASSASTARCAGYRAWRRWSTRSATSTSSCRFPMRSRRGSCHGARLGLRPTSHGGDVPPG